MTPNFCSTIVYVPHHLSRGKLHAFVPTVQWIMIILIFRPTLSRQRRGYYVGHVQLTRINLCFGGVFSANLSMFWSILVLLQPEKCRQYALSSGQGRPPAGEISDQFG
jgi:hypothetical protein